MNTLCILNRDKLNLVIICVWYLCSQVSIVLLVVNQIYTQIHRFHWITRPYKPLCIHSKASKLVNIFQNMYPFSYKSVRDYDENLRLAVCCELSKAFQSKSNKTTNNKYDLSQCYSFQLQQLPIPCRRTGRHA